MGRLRPEHRRPLLVGELNPHRSDPRLALYPYPPGCAGARLQEKVLGVSMREYLRRYDRVNLCCGRYTTAEARAVAAALRERMERWADSEPRGRSRAVAVLLGAKVSAAFGLDFVPFRVMAMSGRWRAVQLPHPSGRNRMWNDPAAIERARAALREAGAL